MGKLPNGTRIGPILFFMFILSIFCLWTTPTHAKWTSIGPDGGYIRSLAINPKTPTTHYAGTGKGVYMSTNGGASWTGPYLPDTTVYSLAIDPKTPTTLYAGTDYGVYKSTNGGLENDNLIDNPNSGFDLTE